MYNTKTPVFYGGGNTHAPNYVVNTAVNEEPNLRDAGCSKHSSVGADRINVQSDFLSCQLARAVLVCWSNTLNAFALLEILL